jgi:hypothetical protein
MDRLMALIDFQASREMPVPASVVYSVIADYRNGHPAILPKPPFVDLVVEQGGTGAGTVIRMRMKLLGKESTMRAAVSEPQPGRVLLEKALDQDLQTFFIVEPVGSKDGAAEHSRTTFHTIINAPGLGGWLQKWIVPRLLLPAYHQELANLEAHAQALWWVEKAKPG